MRLIYLCLIIFAFVGCTRQANDGPAKVAIKLPAKATIYSQSKLAQPRIMRSADNMVPWGMPDPLSIAEISCYAIIVSGPEFDLNKNTCYDTNGMTVLKGGLFFGGYMPEQEITIEVPAGSSRTISVVGFATSSPAACMMLSTTLMPYEFSAPFIIGSSTKDLPPSTTTTVDINVSLVNSTKFNYCDFYNGPQTPDNPACPTCPTWPTPTPSPTTSPTPDPTMPYITSNCTSLISTTNYNCNANVEISAIVQSGWTWAVDVANNTCPWNSIMMSGMINGSGITEGSCRIAIQATKDGQSIYYSLDVVAQFPPADATDLIWSIMTTTSPNVTATWVKSTSTLSGQTMLIYRNSCSEIDKINEIGLSSSQQSYNFTIPTEGDYYYFKITSIKAGGASITSPCSGSTYLDATGPAVSFSTPPGQTPATDALPIDLLMTTSEDIMETPSNANITITNGTATGVTYSVQSYGGYSWRIRVTDITVPGTIEFSVVSGAYHDFVGNANTTTVSAAILTYTPRTFSVANSIPGAANDLFGHSVALIGDWDGDGNQEYAVGAHGVLNSGNGKVYVYRGLASPTLVYTLTGEALNDQFGWSVGSVSDYNSDGKPELVIGAPQQGPPTAQGKVYIYSYNSGSPLLLCSKTGGAASDNFGSTIQGLPNGVMAVSSRILSTSSNGKVDLFNGCSSYPGGVLNTPIATYMGEYANDFFGQALGMADVNGDSVMDLLATSPGYIQFSSTGKLYVFDGANWPNTTPIKTKDYYGGSGFGNSVVGIGDNNDDGQGDEIVLGLPDYMAFYTGKLVALTSPFFNEQTVVDGYSDIYGPSVDWADHYSIGDTVTSGDINGDGKLDVIASAPGTGLTDKKIFIYSGNGFKKLGEITLIGSSECGLLSLATKNLDVDIYDEIIVGCQGHTTNAGRVFLIDVN